MHITSYIIAHMVYQAFLCLIQSVAVIIVFSMVKVKLPTKGLITGVGLVDFAITIFLITYAADMISLFISCLAKNTTAAMTIMPFILMVELVFSGGMFALPSSINGVKQTMVSYHGLSCICAEAEYNELPSITGWKMMKKMTKNPETDPEIVAMVKEMEATGQDEQINMRMAESNQRFDFRTTANNIKSRWFLMSLLAFLFAFLSILVLKRIDKDKR